MLQVLQATACQLCLCRCTADVRVLARPQRSSPSAADICGAVQYGTGMSRSRCRRSDAGYHVQRYGCCVARATPRKAVRPAGLRGYSSGAKIRLELGQRWRCNSHRRRLGDGRGFLGWWCRGRRRRLPFLFVCIGPTAAPFGDGCALPLELRCLRRTTVARASTSRHTSARANSRHSTARHGTEARASRSNRAASSSESCPSAACAAGAEDRRALDTPLDVTMPNPPGLALPSNARTKLRCGQRANRHREWMRRMARQITNRATKETRYRPLVPCEARKHAHAHTGRRMRALTSVRRTGRGGLRL